MSIREHWHSRFGHQWGFPEIVEITTGRLAVRANCPCGLIRVIWLEHLIPTLCDYFWKHHEPELAASYDRVNTHG